MRRLLLFLLIVAFILVGCTRPKPRPPTPTPVPPEAVAQQQVQPTPVETPGVQETPQPSETPVPTPTPSSPPSEQITPVAPTPSQAQPQPSAEGGYIFYEVRWGDTLESIANRFGTTVEALVQLNGITDEDFIYVGQRLRIPGQAQQVTPSPQVSEYVVQPGDTLTSIAARFNTTVEAIMAANRIINPNFIYVGQKLTIPGGAGTSVPTTQPRIHIVQWGETLTSIAFRYGTTVEAIVRANNLPNPNFIYAGQRLVIP